MIRWWRLRNNCEYVFLSGSSILYAKICTFGKGLIQLVSFESISKLLVVLGTVFPDDGLSRYDDFHCNGNSYTGKKTSLCLNGSQATSHYEYSYFGDWSLIGKVLIAHDMRFMFNFRDRRTNRQRGTETQTHTHTLYVWFKTFTIE